MKEEQEEKFIANGEDLSQSDQRNIEYTNLVKKIISNNDTTQIFKYIFFVIVCIVFIAVAIIGIVAIIIIAKKDEPNYTDLGVAITGLGSVLSSIIVLPKIIAKHLFPENSEKVRFDFVSQNQKYDLGQPDFIDEYGLDDGELLGESENSSEENNN